MDTAIGDPYQSRYSYVGDNPTRFSDPSGLKAFDWAIGHATFANVFGRYTYLANNLPISFQNKWDDIVPNMSLHTALDVIGMVPGFGEWADSANGMLYLAEGNKTDAAISFAAMAIGFGSTIGGARAARNTPTSSKPTSCPFPFKSFSADTQVVMADGTSTPISEIQLGDLVLATNPGTGETSGREVTNLWVHGDELVDLVTDAGSVTTTWDHPFWNETDQQWQQAAALDAGDLLLTADGSTFTVDEIDWSTATLGGAYNLTVDGTHTYYITVGDAEALVHNCGGAPSRVPELSNPSTVNNASAPIRSFVTQTDAVYYRVYSGDRMVGRFLTSAPPGSSTEAVSALALPPANQATFVQEVVVPAGTRIQSSIAAEAFGQTGGGLQFELLEHIPLSSFGPGVPLS